MIFFLTGLQDCFCCHGNGDFVNALGGSGTGSFYISLKNSSDSVVSTTTISYDISTDTLNNIITKINQSDAGITASYLENAGPDGRFILNSDILRDYYIDVETGGNDTQNLLNILDTAL